MTRSFMITAATVVALSGASMAYADAHTGGFMVDNAVAASADANATLGASVGLPVTSMDGTVFGVVERAEIDGTGNAEIFVDTTGYDDVVRDGDKLILTVDAKDVSVTEAAVALNIAQEQLINNINDGRGNGRYSKATITN